jgi:error-prone DNA polymerase
VPITQLIVHRLIDRSDLLDGLTDRGIAAGDSGWVERMLGRADEVRRPEPGSRDFR